MEKLFAPAWLTAWLAGWLPKSIFKVGKKTPWYRRSWVEFAPWIAGAAALPILAAGAWFGLRALTGSKPQDS